LFEYGKAVGILDVEKRVNDAVSKGVEEYNQRAMTFDFLGSNG